MENMRLPKYRRPTSPMEMIREWILEGYNLTQGQLAQRIGVSRVTVVELVNNKRKVTVDMAHRLGKLTNTSPEMWLNAQKAVDIWDFKNSKAFEKLPAIEPLVA